MVETKEKEIKKIKWEEALEKEPWVAPVTDIYETENEYILESFMPGVSKDGVKIKLEEEHLVLMGKIEYDSLKDRKYILKESDSSNFFRKVNLSKGIDTEKIDATMINGVLRVSLPKLPHLKPKTIEIN